MGGCQARLAHLPPARERPARAWRCARGSGARRETARCFHRAGCRTTPSTPGVSGPASVWFRLWGIVPVVERHREVLNAEVGGIEGFVGGDVIRRDRVLVLASA